MNDMDNLIESFRRNQTPEKLAQLQSKGVGLREIRNNGWERLERYELPLERFIPLYNNQYEIYALGIF